MISTEQRKLYWANLNAVMEKVGTVAPRGPSGNVGCNDSLPPSAQDISEFRAAFHAQHNLPASTKDFTKAHMDTFLAACAAITQSDNLKPQLRAINQPKARLLHKIVVDQAAMLRALGKPDPLATIAQICADKFRGRKPADLSDSHRSVFGSQYSELQMLMFTVARQISELRQARLWSQHELLWNAGLGKTCECADCRHARHPKPKIKIPRELVADNVPF